MSLVSFVWLETVSQTHQIIWAESRHRERAATTWSQLWLAAFSRKMDIHHGSCAIKSVYFGVHMVVHSCLRREAVSHHGTHSIFNADENWDVDLVYLVKFVSICHFHQASFVICAVIFIGWKFFFPGIACSHQYNLQLCCVQQDHGSNPCRLSSQLFLIRLNLTLEVATQSKDEVPTLWMTEKGRQDMAKILQTWEGI